MDPKPPKSEYEVVEPTTSTRCNPRLFPSAAISGSHNRANARMSQPSGSRTEELVQAHSVLARAALDQETARVREIVENNPQFATDPREAVSHTVALNARYPPLRGGLQ